ncbi:MAG: PepSY-like domain-containing protein [Flavobacteriales bacterium]|nr:PepSY-like domain-containing protein [Flavobacteriales bacterium]
MFNRTVLAVTFLTTSFCASGQTKVNPPAAARTHLNSTYAGAVVKEWKEGKKHFKAEFRLKDETYRAYYTAEGAWVRTEHNVKKGELPAAVTAALERSKYGKWKIADAEEHASPQQASFYRVRVKTETKKAELDFAPDGKLLKEEEKAK